MLFRRAASSGARSCQRQLLRAPCAVARRELTTSSSISSSPRPPSSSTCGVHASFYRHASGTVGDEEEKSTPKLSLLDRFLAYLPQDGAVVLAETLVDSCAKQSEDENFFKCCGIPTSNSMPRLSLKAIHIWILHQRISRDSKEAHQQDLVFKMYEKLWEDLDNEMYDSGLLFLTKHLKQAQGNVYGSLYSYDQALQIYNTDGDCDAFLGALWRNLYQGKKDLNRAHLCQMRDYIFREIETVNEQSHKDFYTGFLKWGPVPSSLPEPSEEAKGLDPALADVKMVDRDEGRRYLSF